mgnify:CR=1 FL=1
MTDDGHTYTWRTNYETTMQCVSGKLVEVFGGRIRVRKVDGVRYLDYLAEYPNTNSQVVELVQNSHWLRAAAHQVQVHHGDLQHQVLKLALPQVFPGFLQQLGRVRNIRPAWTRCFP